MITGPSASFNLVDHGGQAFSRLNMNSPSKGPHRLLYRGAISIPDSHLLLDGITFSARLDAEHKLLDNPLALALETMRKRPALRYLGTTNLNDIYMDGSGDISIDIHPEAILSRIYFENIFCLPTTSSDRLGIRVALGDTDGPETTQIVIYIRATTSSDNVISAELAVARITPAPPARLPRPDDPTPRKPPTDSNNRTREFRRLPSVNIAANIRPNISANSLAASLGSGVRVGKAQPEFKVPALPTKVKPKSTKDKGKGKALEVKDDVFAVGPATGGNKGVKRKRSDGLESQSNAVENETPLERQNKNLIKRASIDQLSGASVTKSDPEWKDLFSFVYHGVIFALRSEMKLHCIEQQTIDRLVATHVSMYTNPQAGDK
ncbi:hypothetical protein V5O48_007054 [Marasmius crinis-equi]|uniref:Sld7 C-terminal domain-containing protein n=1 Tax=Marasmius crinis-equi TaxID=585013 RepID=A0ABR3FI09_9AGAR